MALPADPVDRSAMALLGFSHNRTAQIIVDGQWHVVLASAGASTLLERSVEEIEGMNLESLVTSLDVFAGCENHECPEKGCFRQLDLVLPQRNLAAEIHCQKIQDAQGRWYHNLVLHDVGELEARDAMRAARLAKLNLLNQVSEALYGAQLSLPQVLESVLIAMTAGQGLRFNRAFLLLVDERSRTLKGEIAIGPSSRAEAEQIWRDLDDQPTDLYEMMTSYDLSLRETDVSVNNIVRHMSVDLDDDDHVLIRAMHARRVVHVTEKHDMPGLDGVREWLKAASTE